MFAAVVHNGRRVSVTYMIMCALVLWLPLEEH